MFKIGDKLKCVKYSEWVSVNEGETCTFDCYVERDEEFDCMIKKDDGGLRFANSNNFERVVY